MSNKVNRELGFLGGFGFGIIWCALVSQFWFFLWFGIPIALVFLVFVFGEMYKKENLVNG